MLGVFTYKPGTDVRSNTCMLSWMEGILQAVVLAGAVEQGRMSFQNVTRWVANGVSLSRHPVPT